MHAAKCYLPFQRTDTGYEGTRPVHASLTAEPKHCRLLDVGSVGWMGYQLVLRYWQSSEFAAAQSLHGASSSAIAFQNLPALATDMEKAFGPNDQHGPVADPKQLEVAPSHCFAPCFLFRQFESSVAASSALHV